MYAHTYTRTYIKCYKNFYFTISQIKKANDQGDQEGWETSGVMFHLLRQQIELRTSDKLEALDSDPSATCSSNSALRLF